MEHAPCVFSLRKSSAVDYRYSCTQSSCCYVHAANPLKPDSAAEQSSVVPTALAPYFKHSKETNSHAKVGLFEMSGL